MNNKHKEEPEGSFLFVRVKRMHIILFIIGVGLGLGLGFYAGITAKETAKEEKARKWKRRR